MRTYQNRQHAGRGLAKVLAEYDNQPDTIILALPRGGVPVATEIAQALNLPLDIFVVRKLGTPGHEEMAMGAIASGGVRILSKDLIKALDISQSEIETVTEREYQELQRRETAYRDGRTMPELNNKTVILVDDGTATGSSMKAAIQGLRQHNPMKIVVALPVGSQEACKEIGQMVDELTCLMTPSNFRGVGAWYDKFDQTSDDEVRHLLQQANEREAIAKS
ncbi:MAG: phosphoribosyltransferase [Anaerolineae bacterium]